MKKLLLKVLSVAMAVLIGASVGAFASAAEPPTNVRIVIPENANNYEKAAAEYLKSTVMASTGVEYDIVTDTTAPEGYEIAVGNTNRLSADVSNLDDGAYVIKTFNGGVAVVGAGTRGNIYGVCRLLKDYGGYRCYVSGESLTNDGSALAIPENVDIEYKPFFEYTETDWRLGSTKNEEYCISNGLNGGAYSRISDAYGGTVNYISGFCHTLATQFCSRDKYFESHPEYFAWRNGQRVSKQLCLTNDDVYEIVKNEVFDLLKNRYDPNAALQIISLTQDDNQEYCQCDNCKKLDNANGSQAGSMLTFINKIAKDVAAAKNGKYANVAIDTFAYQYTRTPPKVVRPEPNVIVRLCSIECCFSHPFDESTCSRNSKFMSDLNEWSKICNRLYVWDYATNYAYTTAVFPNFGVLQKNMQILYEHNVKGVYVEGNYYLADVDTEFADLRSYLIACLLADPYCDYDAKMREFCNDYYGAGGQQIYEFIQMTISGAKKYNHLSIYNGILTSLSFTRSEVKKCDSLWDEAKRNTVNDEQAYKNIVRSEISWRMWKSSACRGEFAGLGLFPERMRLYRDVLDSGAKRFTEGKRINSLSLKLILGDPNNWNNQKENETKDYTDLMTKCIALYDAFMSFFSIFKISC